MRKWGIFLLVESLEHSHLQKFGKTWFFFQVQALLLYRGFLGLWKTVLKENRALGGVF